MSECRGYKPPLPPREVIPLWRNTRLVSPMTSQSLLMSHPAQLSNALSRVFAPPPTVSGWDTAPNPSTPAPPSCHSEMAQGFPLPPRAATWRHLLPGSLPGRLARGDRLAETSGRVMCSAQIRGPE